MKSLVRSIVPAFFVISAATAVVHAQSADKQAQTTDKSTPALGRERPTPETMQRLEDGRIAMIKGALKMTDAQLKLWTPVENLLRTQREDRQKLIQERMASGGRGAARPSLPDRLDRESTMMSKRADDTKAFVAVFRPFYDLLTDGQKVVADPLFDQRGGGHHMRGHRWAGGRGPTQQQ